ncbi:hypothetical protein [Haliangium sp.]
MAIVSARYDNELSLGEDGRWRTTRFPLRVDGYWRGTGSFPFAR